MRFSYEGLQSAGLKSRAASGARSMLALLVLLGFALLTFLGCTTPQPAASENSIVTRRLELVDTSRPTSAAFNFPGSPSRRLDTIVWYPAHASGRLPLVIYSHGTYGRPDNAMHIVEHLVRHGYIVAAPAYPLTSSVSSTHVPSAYTPDVANQPADTSFIITQLLADPVLGSRIDPNAIGSTGHSLGAVTSYFVSFAAQTRDPRIKANALIAGGDPIGANTGWHLGFQDVAVPREHTPVLFLSADDDVFANLAGPHFAAYGRVGAPKYELMIHRGVHVYFRDGYDNETRSDGKNPDCAFFEQARMNVPGCDRPGQFIARERQQEITRDALLTFFDAYLKHDAAALARLRNFGAFYPETELRKQD